MKLSIECSFSLSMPTSYDDIYSTNQSLLSINVTAKEAYSINEV